jgi:hypothetical protein
MIVIGITGLAGSGKSTLASELVHRMGGLSRTAVLPFATPIKNIVAGMGIPIKDKDTPCIEAYGQTPRDIMKAIGKLGRDVHPDFWVNVWLRNVANAHWFNDIIVDDVRYPNEAAAIRGLGGWIINVTRPGVVQVDHETETQVIPWDMQIVNDGSHQDLINALLRVREVIFEKAPATGNQKNV